MIAYKGFQPGLICRGYRFVMGLNTTAEANCGANGFHCAEDPLDCLSYYGDMECSEYYLVQPGGDIDEDERDSKIACTELTIIKKLEREEFFIHALAYMVVRGADPVASGKKGDILAFAKEAPAGDKIVQIALVRVDGRKIKPNTWYDINLKERKVA